MRWIYRSSYTYLGVLCCDLFLVELTNLSPEQNGHHFADDIFKCIFMNENLCILIQISLNFVPNKLQAIIWTNADPVHWSL